MLRELVARLGGRRAVGCKAAEAGRATAAAHAATADARAVSGPDDVRVCRVDDAEFFVGDLFRRTFGDPPPEAPAHYVAFVRTGGDGFVAAGYYHVAYCGEYALVGGLCVDGRFRKRGIAEKLERFVYRDAGEVKAYFAHVGDPSRSRRVGFVDTAHPHLVVCWMKDVGAEERARIIAEVAALGPF